MNNLRCILNNPLIPRSPNIKIKRISCRTLYSREYSTKSQKKEIEESYKLLNIPVNSKQDVVRTAFLELAKKYHPDSGSKDADINKFVEIENAFRILTKCNTGSTEELENIVYDIKHTAPQHRQYLSFEGVGHGTPFQREKQWIQHRARNAATNVLEHRINKSVASDKTVMKKGQQYSLKHDIKTKYGFDRLVEDLIQESMSKGEFDNLSGKGKPLKDQNSNPYVDFTTHKLNEVLINNGFVPEWITMCKEIDNDIELLKEEVRNERSYLGPYPLSEQDEEKWSHICDENSRLAQSINSKIITYNLIVPILDRQKFLLSFDKICEDILKTGEHSKVNKKVAVETKMAETAPVSNEFDFFSIIYKVCTEIFNLAPKEKKKSVN